MPQASDKLRELWGGEGGIGEDKAYEFLLSKGWKMSATGLWHPPKDYIDQTYAVTFLVDEWDHDVEWPK